MIVVACLITVMYIKPTVSSVSDFQDLTNQYQIETTNVSRVNEDLKGKISTIETIRTEDLNALSRYLPDEVDEVVVLKDLSLILQSAAISKYTLKYTGSSQQSAENLSDTVDMSGQNKLDEYTFALSFQSDYNQLKSLLSLLETNDYLLQVSNLKVTASETGLHDVEINLKAFSRPAITNVAVTDNILIQ